MDADFAALAESITQRFDNVPYIAYNHLAIAHLAPDEAAMTMDVQPEHLNQHGSIHGGYLFLLADTLAGLVALTDGRNYVTQSQSFAFLRPAGVGRLTATGTVVRRGSTVVVVHVAVQREDGALIGDGNFNMYPLQQPLMHG